MSKSWDVVVWGGGHNGLTAAAFLAKAGRKVLLVEAREILGGLAAAEEFHPGYWSAGVLQETTGVRPWVVKELGLEAHGLRRRKSPPAVMALGGGDPILIGGDPEQAAEEIAGISPQDAESYRSYHAFLGRIRPVLDSFLNQPPLDLVGENMLGSWDLIRRALELRRLGRGDMMELLRLPTMCVADWLNEWFTSDLLKAALALPAVSGTFLGPRSPGSNANLLLRECATGPGVEGDGPALIKALEKAARSFGVEIRSSCSVQSLLVEGSSVRGVLLTTNEELLAGVVVSTCDPKQVVLERIPRGKASPRWSRHMQTFRTRGTTAQVLLALDAPPPFSRSAEESVLFARVAADLQTIERAFDAVKYRAFSDNPVLELHLPAASEEVRFPAGHAVLSALVHFAPYNLEGGWDDAQRKKLGDRVVAVLERHAPGIASSVVGRQVLSPMDLEERYQMTGGHIHHGEHSLDQILIRPSPDCATYRAPIDGLFLGGSGSHPGGGLTCAPGALAARIVLDQM